MSLKIPLAQVVSGILATASSAVIIVLYVTGTYQTKEEAKSDREQVERSISDLQVSTKEKYDSVENRLQNMEKVTNSTAVDVSYIKGVLTPKGK